MNGGNNKVIPLFKEPINTPFTSNERREIKTQRFNETKKQPVNTAGVNPATYGIQKDIKDGQDPIVNLQVYEQTKPPPPPPLPPMFYPANTGSIYYPPQWQGPEAGSGAIAMPPAVMQMPNYAYPHIKKYDINISGPVTDHGRVNTIYEDILPSSQFQNTFQTVSERINLCHYIRSILVKSHDGEDINLDGSGDNSIIRYLKFLELNPYNPNQLTNNPYKGLADNILIYSSCYPIRYNPTYNNTMCAPQSTGLNVRIYGLKYGEYLLKRQSMTNYDHYDLWREISFYEYIRDEILKKNVCPNFTMLYAYFINENCSINFNKLKDIKRGNGGHVNPRFRTVNQIADQVQQLKKSYKSAGVSSTLMGGATINPLSVPPFMSTMPSSTNYSMDSYIPKALVAITEAPTYNLLGWASKTYQVNMNIKTMINTGFHRKEVWFSVLFQLFAALYTLQKHFISITDFTIQDNVYIKDIKLTSNVTNHWKYIIEGIEYYVPNYGYLVLIDTNYKDVIQHPTIASRAAASSHSGPIIPNKFKIDAAMFPTTPAAVTFPPATPTMSSNQIRIYNLCYDTFLNIANTNTFSGAFTTAGGVRPINEVMVLLNIIRRNSNSSISEHIEETMSMFFNNRIGTSLKENEIKNVSPNPGLNNPKKGDIIVHIDSYNNYKFVMFIDQTPGSANINIYTIVHPNTNITRIPVNSSSLREYNFVEPIAQNYKPTESNFNESDLLGIYNL